MIDSVEIGRQFAALFARFEYALKRSGFRKDRDVAEADWQKFAEALGNSFSTM